MAMFMEIQQFFLNTNKIIKMLDITSYRRKSKCVAPLTVMREFYYDYTYTSASKNRQKSCVEVDPLLKRTLSMEKFNKCLQELQRNSQRQTQKQLTTESEKSSIQKIRPHPNNCVIKKQSDCFKCTFSTSVPILKCHQAIKDMAEHCRKMADQKQNSKKPQIVNILFSRRKLQIRNQTKQYAQMCEEKQKLAAKSKAKKERLRKIRQSDLITNLYHKAEQEGQKTVRKRYRIRDLFSTTQENIFPN